MYTMINVNRIIIFYYVSPYIYLANVYRIHRSGCCSLPSLLCFGPSMENGIIRQTDQTGLAFHDIYQVFEHSKK